MIAKLSPAPSSGWAHGKSLLITQQGGTLSLAPWFVLPRAAPCSHAFFFFPYFFGIFFFYLTPSWADTRTEVEELPYFSPVGNRAYSWKGQRGGKRSHTRSFWHCSITKMPGHLLLASVGLGSLQSKPLSRHSTASFQGTTSSVCTPISGIPGRLRTDWGTAGPIFYKSGFLRTVFSSVKAISIMAKELWFCWH